MTRRRVRRARFDWWDDAVAVARALAAQSGRRYRVYAIDGGAAWAVAPSLTVVRPGLEDV